MIDMHDPIVRDVRESGAAKRCLLAAIAAIVLLDAILILWSRL